MECEIIRDLLALYHDGVCSPESRRAVEEHLNACEDCRAALSVMDDPLPEPEKRETADGAAAVGRISAEWKKGRRRAKLRGAAIAAAVCAALVGSWVAATEGLWFPVDPERIRITDVRQLSDGRVLYHFYLDDDLSLRTIRFEFDDGGNAYLIPKRALLTQKRQEPSLANSERCLDVAEQNVWGRDRGYDSEITRVWYGQGDDKILLWEEGMVLPAASAADEQAWGFETGSADYWSERNGEKAGASEDASGTA